MQIQKSKTIKIEPASHLDRKKKPAEAVNKTKEFLIQSSRKRKRKTTQKHIIILKCQNPTKITWEGTKILKFWYFFMMLYRKTKIGNNFEALSKYKGEKSEERKELDSPIDNFLLFQFRSEQPMNG